MGRILWEQGKLEETIATYKKTLAIRPDSAESYINLGFAFWEQGKIEETIESYKAALSINTHNDEAYWYPFAVASAIKSSIKVAFDCDITSAAAFLSYADCIFNPINTCDAPFPLS